MGGSERPGRGPRPPRPVVKSLLLCDTIIHDAATNKKSLIGVFHDMIAAQFPFQHPSLSLYANLADAAGEYALEVRLVNLSAAREVARHRLPPARIGDRLRPAEIAVQMVGVLFQDAGRYEIQLWANDELIGSRDFTVQKGPMPGAPGAPPPQPEGPT
ncbi:MAG: hypothetical protein L0216_01605 [Planctomycetales bacterium]|nr:hypothetical protein [Planctomycetales bacterium]